MGFLRVIALVSLAWLAMGCSTGIRLYQRAESAASAAEWPKAIAYDAKAALDPRAQPPEFAHSYEAHFASYAAYSLAQLGPPSAENADAQAASVRGLLAWARTQKVEVGAAPSLVARLGELTHLRWDRVRRLSAAGSVDEAVVVGRGLVVDTPAESAERTELAALEKKAREAHESDVVLLASLPGHEGATALAERLAKQMGGEATANGTAAEAALTRQTAINAKFDATNAGACTAAVENLRRRMPSGGETSAQFHFRFARCTPREETSTLASVRETEVTDYTDRTVSDLVPGLECRTVRTGSATICDGRGRNGCHEEETDGQSCVNTLRPVERTERVRRTRIVQTPYTINYLEHLIDYQVSLSADIDGQHFEVESASIATSGRLSASDSMPSAKTADDVATLDLTRRLEGFTESLAAFARRTQAERMRREAKAASNPDLAESLYVQASIVQDEVLEELVRPTRSREQLTAALRNRLWQRPDSVGHGPELPVVPEAEVLEDAHERVDSMSLSAETRAGFSGGIVGGVSRYEGPTSGDSTTGGFIGALVTGAQQFGTKYTSAGGSFHLFGNFDGGTSSFDASLDFGLGLKLWTIYVMPVVGGAAGTSTHADPTDGFRPNAALRATALDGVYGGQVTIALPYPLNATLHSQLVRTAPIPLNDFKQWTTRLYVAVEYHFSKDVGVSLFGRYWELDTKSVAALDFFAGDGKDHRLMTLGLGIGGSSDKFVDSLFGLKSD